MKIFVISLKNISREELDKITKGSLDFNSEHIIVASSKTDCIQLAQKNCGCEGKSVWQKANIEEIGNYTGNKTISHIVMTLNHNF